MLEAFARFPMPASFIGYGFRYHLRTMARTLLLATAAAITFASMGYGLSQLVVIPAAGKTADQAQELTRSRLSIRLKWAPYHNVTIRQPDGKDVQYARPDLTQLRMLDSPVAASSEFAIGDGMTLTLRPRRWEQGTQRFVLETIIETDPNSKDPSQAERTVQTASGTLQSTAEGKWLFVGESRWTIYSPSGDLVADFSLGSFPETTDAGSPPVAQRD